MTHGSLNYQLQWMGVPNLKPGIYNNTDIDNKAV